MMLSFVNNNSDLEIGIDQLPGQKRMSLVVQEGNKETKLATFVNEESAYLFVQKMTEFLGMEFIEDSIPQ